MISAIVLFRRVDRAVMPREEAYLARGFGEEYARYRRRVRRRV